MRENSFLQMLIIALFFGAIIGGCAGVADAISDMQEEKIEKLTQHRVDTIDVKRHTQIMMHRVKHKIMYLYYTENAGIFEGDVEREIQALIDSSNTVLDSCYYENELLIKNE